MSNDQRITDARLGKPVILQVGDLVEVEEHLKNRWFKGPWMGVIREVRQSTAGHGMIYKVEVIEHGPKTFEFVDWKSYAIYPGHLETPDRITYRGRYER